MLRKMGSWLRSQGGRLNGSRLSNIPLSARMQQAGIEDKEVKMRRQKYYNAYYTT
jgi:hypothetical protein